MLSLGKRNPEELTFKARVERFWEWYAQNSARFYDMLNGGRMNELVSEVTDTIDGWFPDFAWVFGPGEGGIDDPDRSFTLSGENVLQKQLLTIYWQSRAPILKGWTFYASRQPSPPELIETMRIDFEGQELNPLEFWLTPTIDEEAEQVSLTVWHPLFAEVPEDERRIGAFFVFLDEALGEIGSGQWIAEVTTIDQQLSDAIPLTELSAFIDKLETEKGWQKLLPGEEATVYEREDPGTRFLRDDIQVGSTVLWDLIMDYIDAEGKMEDPLAGTGADYVFVSMDRQLFPEGQEMDRRDAIEAALSQALASEHSGRMLGGAFGTQHAYLDLMLFDGRNSLEIVERVLRERNLPNGTSINFFAEDKASQRVVLGAYSHGSQET